MNLLINGDGWASVEVFIYALLIAYFVAPIICIVVFVLRKNKLWFNYFALGGELLFFVHLLFHIQHYPGQLEIGIAGSLFLLIAFIATLLAVNKKKIEASLKLGVILCLYMLMILNLSGGALQHIQMNLAKKPEIESQPNLAGERYRDSILKAYPEDTSHRR